MPDDVSVRARSNRVEPGIARSAMMQAFSSFLGEAKNSSGEEKVSTRRFSDRNSLANSILGTTSSVSVSHTCLAKSHSATPRKAFPSVMRLD